MNRLVVPQVYTIIAFGASTFLWFYIPSVALGPWAEGMPLGLIHPYFTAELFLMLSTVVAWVMAMLISLYNLRKQKLSLTKSMFQNEFEIFLALATIIVAISGCIFYFEPFHFGWYHDDLTGLPATLPAPSPPNPLALFNAMGILVCEVLWIVTGLQAFTNRYISSRHRRS